MKNSNLFLISMSLTIAYIYMTTENTFIIDKK